MTDLEQEAYAAIDGITLYEYNVAHVDIISEIYGDDHHKNYLEEKLDLLNKKGILYLWGQLDGFHRKQLIRAMYARYRSEVTEKAGIKE